MNIFKSKGIIRLYAFITACIIVITIIASSVDAFAEELFSYQDAYNFSEIQFLHYADNETDFQYATANTIAECQYLINSNLFTCPSSYSINTTTFPNYVIIYNNSNHRFYVMYADADAFVTVYRGQNGLVNLNSANFDGNFRYRISRWSYPTGYVESLDDFTNSNPPYYDVYENQNDNDPTEFYQCSLYGYQIVASTVPIYIEQNGTRDIYLDEVENINPTYSGSVGNVSGDQWDNFEYLTGQSGIYFQCANCNNGNVQFVAQYPNSLENPENFTIRVSGSCTYSIKYKGGAVTNFSSIMKNYTSGSLAVGNVYTVNGSLFDPFIMFDTRLDNMGNSIKNYSLGGSGSPSTLSSDINPHMKTSSGAPISYLAEYLTGNRVAIWQSTWNSIGSIADDSILGNNTASIKSIEADDIEIQTLSYTFNMSLYKNDNSDGQINTNSELVGEMSRTYNFLSGESSETTNTLSVDDNTVSDNTDGGEDFYNHSTDFNTNYNGSGSGSGSGGGSVVGGDNNIVINNNPTFNNTGGSSSGGGSNTESDASLLSFFDTFNPFKTIFNKLSGNNEVIADDTAETIGANRFITVISSTFGFIPTEIWTTLAWFLGASLAILIVAVVLRIILDLL